MYYNGSVLERYEYDAYGNCYILEPNFAPDPDGKSDYGNPYLFTGRRVDILDNGSLKIQYNRNRYYDQYTGRWLTHDPHGMANYLLPKQQYFDGMNLYQYVHSNPANARDPLGLWGWPTFSLGEKIGFIFITRVLTPGPINWLRSNEYSLNDSEGEMTSGLKVKMEKFYVSQIKDKCEGELEFDTRNAPGEWKLEPTGWGIFSAGWWLNVAHRVSAKGSFEYCCKNRYCSLTHVSVNWEWYDDIDAKNFVEALDEYEKGAEGYGWLERRLASIGLTIEALWDIFGDKIADTDFRVRIKWEDRRTGPLGIAR